MSVFVDLFAAFDTINNDNLCCIMETYVQIYGNALKLITGKSYFQIVLYCLTLLILFVVFF